jgi:hypothetical protein
VTAAGAGDGQQEREDLEERAVNERELNSTLEVATFMEGETVQVGHGDRCVALIVRRSAVLTPLGARQLAALLVAQADASERSS